MTHSNPTRSTRATTRRDTQRVALCSAVLPVWRQQLALSVEQSTEAVSEMLFAFSQLGPLLEGLADVDPRFGSLEHIKAQVDKMYVGFQYQDRISQVLTLLQVDISRMMEAMTDEPKTQDALQGAIWLGRLESEYVMAEQHSPAGSPHDSANELTFF